MFVNTTATKLKRSHCPANVPPRTCLKIIVINLLFFFHPLITDSPLRLNNKRPSSAISEKSPLSSTKPSSGGPPAKVNKNLIHKKRDSAEKTNLYTEETKPQKMAFQFHVVGPCAKIRVWGPHSSVRKWIICCFLAFSRFCCCWCWF